MAVELDITLSCIEIAKVDANPCFIGNQLYTVGVHSPECARVDGQLWRLAFALYRHNSAIRLHAIGASNDAQVFGM